MHRLAIRAILLVQIFRCLQIDSYKNCYTTLQFQEQEGEIHQYLYHWTQCHSAKENVDDFLDKETKDVLQLLQMYLVPTMKFVHAAVQHICQAMLCVGVTVDTHPFVSALAIQEELLQLWRAGPVLLSCCCCLQQVQLDASSAASSKFAYMNSSASGRGI